MNGKKKFETVDVLQCLKMHSKKSNEPAGREFGSKSEIWILSIAKNALETIPDVRRLVGDSFIENLNTKRQAITVTRTNKKMKKLNVPLGRSISVAELEQPSTSGISTEKTDSDSDNESLGHVSYAESDVSNTLADESDSETSPNITEKHLRKDDIRDGDFVIAMYENVPYPGLLREVGSDAA